MKLRLGFFLAVTSLSAHGVVTPDELDDVAQTTGPLAVHCDADVAGGDFLAIFLCGDELFETRFNALDGGGMNVGDGGRYTRVPRADLVNWSTTIPARATGPNASACNVCHLPESIGNAGDGAGPPALNAIRDPLHTGTPGGFIQRNVPHLFGMAGPQLVAETMTDDLADDVSRAISSVCNNANNPHQRPRTRRLRTKGIDFGHVRVSGHCPDPQVDVFAEGIDDDLIVRPFQWKGTELSVRTFSRDAFHNELGMSPVELSGDDVDSDFDGVANEISIADVTAMTIYLAAQPRPTTLLELDRLRRDIANNPGGPELAE